MAFPGTYNISYYEGDTYEFNIRPKNTDGSEFNLTDYASVFTIATARGAGATQIQCTAEISGNTVNCVILPGQGRQLTAGTTYYYDVQVSKTTSAGVLVVHTLLTGTVSVTADVSGAV
jgi:hypothetical protein